MDNKKVVLDTNILLDSYHLIQEYDCVLLSHTLRELDKHKMSHNYELAYNARQAVRFIEQNINKVTFDVKDYPSIDGYDEGYQDNRILKACLDNNYSLASRDLLIKQKARAFGIEVVDVDRLNEEEYDGYKELELTDEQIAYFYENFDKNLYNLLPNQYVIIKDLWGKYVESAKWDGQYIQLAHNKGFTTQLFGKFKPYDNFQTCALDSLVSNQMTMLKGKAGSGKSLIALNYSMSLLEKNKYDKLIIFVNPLNSRGAAKLGFYPGSRDQKLLDSFVGSMLASKFGDMSHVENMINSQKLLLLPMGDIRGFDTTGMKAICYICEAQNMSVDLMKLAIQRVGDDSKLIIDGDYEAQVDSKDFEGYNNGMRRVSEVFRRRDFYGEVKLPIVYRSKMASIADLM